MKIRDLRNLNDAELMDFCRRNPFMGGACLDCGVPFATVAMVAATAKSVAGVKAPANQALKIKGFDICFDGTDSSKAGALVEIAHCTFATNGPGTNSTSVTPVALDSGRPETPQATAAKNWTTEPTVITAVEDFLIPTYMGSGIIFIPLTSPMIVKGGVGMVMRITTPTGVTVNATGTIKYEE